MTTAQSASRISAGAETKLNPQHCIYRSVSRLARAVSTTYDTALKPSGLSAGQFTTLMTLALNGPTTVGDLARLISASSTTIPRILIPLLQRNLVTSVPGKDRRQRVVSITRAGERLTRQALPHWERGQREVLANFDGTRWSRLRIEMSALRHCLES